MRREVRIFLAEFIGTMVLVLGGPGAAILAGDQIGTLGVAIAFGLSLLCMAYTIGSISGCHINPAVTVGSWLLNKTPAALVPWYVVAQILGGLLGALVIFGVANGVPGFSASETGFASNGYAEHSPGGYNLASVALVEIVVTLVFVLAVLATSRKSMSPGFTGLSVGLMLTLVHLVSIPVSNTSVNPARSIATAVFQGGWAIAQLWAFIVFPLIGAFLAAVVWRALVPADDA